MTARSAGNRFVSLCCVAAFVIVCAAAASSAAAPVSTAAAQAGHGETAAHDGGAEPAAHGLPQSAVEIGRPFGFPISNSMVVTWIAALLLIVLARAATRRMTDVPGGVQNFFEWIVQSLYEFLESIIGAHLVRRTFWFFATIFIFILASNW